MSNPKIQRRSEYIASSSRDFPNGDEEDLIQFTQAEPFLRRGTSENQTKMEPLIDASVQRGSVDTQEILEEEDKKVQEKKLVQLL